jgi:hypothetical protein
MSSVGLRGRGWRWRIIMDGRGCEGVEARTMCIVRALFGGSDRSMGYRISIEYGYRIEFWYGVRVTVSV